jgi:hypothetical protein
MDGSGTDCLTKSVATASNVGGITTITYNTGNDSLRGVDRWIIKTAGWYSSGTISGEAGTPPTVTRVGTNWAATFGTGNHTDLCFG